MLLNLRQTTELRPDTRNDRGDGDLNLLPLEVTRIQPPFLDLQQREGGSLAGHSQHAKFSVLNDVFFSLFPVPQFVTIEAISLMFGNIFKRDETIRADAYRLTVFAFCIRLEFHLLIDCGAATSILIIGRIM